MYSAGVVFIAALVIVEIAGENIEENNLSSGIRA
jgi:hypothetical protein